MGDCSSSQCPLQTQELLGDHVQAVGRLLEQLPLLLADIQEMPYDWVHGWGASVCVSCLHSPPVSCSLVVGLDMDMGTDVCGEKCSFIFFFWGKS